MIKKIIIPTIRYGMFLLVFYLIQTHLFMGMFNIFSDYIILLYIYFGLRYSLKYIHKEDERYILRIFPYLMGSTSIVLLIILYYWVSSFFFIILAIVFNASILYYLAWQIDKNSLDNITEKNINKYFSKNKH